MLVVGFNAEGLSLFGLPNTEYGTLWQCSFRNYGIKNDIGRESEVRVRVRIKAAISVKYRLP